MSLLELFGIVDDFWQRSTHVASSQNCHGQRKPVAPMGAVIPSRGSSCVKLQLARQQRQEINRCRTDGFKNTPPQRHPAPVSAQRACVLDDERCAAAIQCWYGVVYHSARRWHKGAAHEFVEQHPLLDMMCFPVTCPD
jgi:hypothetical protein